MSRHYLVCPNDNCPRLARTRNRFRSDAADVANCPVCGTALVDASTVTLTKVTTTPPVPPTPDPDSITPPSDSPEKKKEEKSMEKKFDITRAIFWLVVLVIVLLAAGYVFNRLTPATDATQAAVDNTTDQVVANSTFTSTTDGDHITVYRGATDQQTINVDDSWPTYKPNDSIDWTNNSFHMGGGTWTIKSDGIISGDVDVNHIRGEDHTYDNDEDTFLVINVKKGDKVYVNPDWMAWFTSYYKEDLVVAARQAAHPTWTRQWSKLN
jgi:hypothetical protein